MRPGLLHCNAVTLDLSRPQVMGILNVTPDSFSDGGVFLGASRALEHARRMVSEGAAIIDVGGESTRPGAGPVSAGEEIERVVPVIEAIHAALDVPISIDTSKPEVMEAAVNAGAGMINDVRALRLEGAMETASRLGVPVCLMHMQGEPANMQQNATYERVVEEVLDFLTARVAACEAAGIPRGRLLIDPGFGFGKTLAHNLLLLHELDRFLALGLPVLAGLSRKSMLGAILGAPVDERLSGSIALATLAVWQGARVVRAHDVKATVDAVRTCWAVRTTAGNDDFLSLGRVS